MAVDKKSDHVGDHGGRYTDMQGNTKQFTYIDHDPKSKLSAYIPDGTAAEKVKQHRLESIEKILSIPAVFAHAIHEQYTIRGADVNTVQWNETMLRDEGLDSYKLYEIGMMASKLQDFHKRGITP